MAKMLLNIPDSLHSKAKQLAQSEGSSLTAWIAMVISERVGEDWAGGYETIARMTKSSTARGNVFSYTRNKKGSVWIQFENGTRSYIGREQLKLALTLIESTKDALSLGASRTDPPAGSIGNQLLKKFGVNNASYIVAILRDDGHCVVYPSDHDGRSFMVKRA